MVHPLIHYHKRTLNLSEMCHRILGKNSNTKGGDKFRYTVIYLRVNVVWPSRKNYALLACLLKVGNYFLTLSFYILLGLKELFPCLFYSRFNLSLWYPSLKHLYKPVSKYLLRLK